MNWQEEVLIENAKFFGLCALCGHRGELLHEAGSIRSAFKCQNCAADLRVRDLAAILVDEFGRGATDNVRSMVKSETFQKLQILEPSLRGPFTKYFKSLPGYTQSYYWPDLKPGESKNGVRCEDLRRLTFDGAKFNLVLTSDVFEHVFHPEQAFAEIYRVLRSGGMHIFSIPFAWPPVPVSTTRAAENDGHITHSLPEAYHTAGDGGRSLVVTDYGLDIIPMLESIGYRVSVVRRSSPLYPLHTNATFVARKP